MAIRDNFDLIREHLDFSNPGDCYYVQLLRRQADDPMVDGKKDPKYHGNMHSRSIKDYFISSLKHYDDVRDEIKTLCDVFNVRAYIRLNKRNYKQISLCMLKHITEEVYSGETYASPFHMVSSAAGKANIAGKEKTWIFDEDAEYVPYEDKIKAMIEQCEPFGVQKCLFMVPTKSGRHQITRPFNVMKFKNMWAADPELSKLPCPDMHKDNPTILYVPSRNVVTIEEE